MLKGRNNRNQHSPKFYWQMNVTHETSFSLLAIHKSTSDRLHSFSGVDFSIFNWRGCVVMINIRIEIDVFINQRDASKCRVDLCLDKFRQMWWLNFLRSFTQKVNCYPVKSIMFHIFLSGIIDAWNNCYKLPQFRKKCPIWLTHSLLTFITSTRFAWFKTL